MKRIYLIASIVVSLVLSACGSTSNPEAIPTVVIDGGNNTDTPKPASSSSNRDGNVIASAIVVPAQEAYLAFVTGGNVMKVNVEVGDRITAGHILVELDSTLAQLEVERAQRTLRELTSPGAIAAAEEAVVNALETRDDEAQDVIGLDYGRASEDLLDEVQAEITLAEKRYEFAEAAYKQVSNRPLDNPARASALLALNDAKNYLNGLRADYQWYISPPSETDVAKTTAEAAVAEAAYQEAQWYLAALKGEDIPADASGPMLTQLQQARADLAAAQNRLEQTRLTAPIDGIVAQINIIAGEFATPGMTLVIISDLDHLQVKTTDLSERDIINVSVGDPATITVDALAEEFSGTVTSISPVADTLGGDVVYEVTITFNEQPAGALGGMTAEVTIGE
ncbi:MAG TPA: efflux RND transporter periplasmic adaptor subunit [Anaerolineales bacterium]|nr:efflux RND transporter periplasmic adaptor subunit [Anaerolineales bacterium]